MLPNVPSCQDTSLTQCYYLRRPQTPKVSFTSLQQAFNMFSIIITLLTLLILINFATGSLLTPQLGERTLRDPLPVQPLPSLTTPVPPTNSTVTLVYSSNCQYTSGAGPAYAPTSTSAKQTPSATWAVYPNTLVTTITIVPTAISPTVTKYSTIYPPAVISGPAPPVTSLAMNHSSTSQTTSQTAGQNTTQSASSTSSTTLASSAKQRNARDTMIRIVFVTFAAAAARLI